MSTEINTILAACVDFKVKRGDYFQETGFLTDTENNDAPVDLESYAGTAVLQIKRNKNDLIPIKKLAEGDGLLIEDTNKITITFTADFKEGIYFYDLSGQVAGKTYTTQEGRMFVDNDVVK